MKALHQADFKEFKIVSCGILRRELSCLNETGFLNSGKIVYTAPGLHEIPRELEKQLKRQIEKNKKGPQKILVLYGEKCYLDNKDPLRGIDRIIQETSANARRVRAKNCIDMIAGIDERNMIAGGQKIYWLTPGWLEYRRLIFKDWDRGKANETFPRHDKAVLLDPVGIYEKYSADYPEKILEFADWMRLTVEPYKISLDRLKHLLLDARF